MGIEVFGLGNLGDGFQKIPSTDAGATGDGDDARRDMASLAIFRDPRLQLIRIHLIGMPASTMSDLDQIVLPDPRDPTRPVDGGMHLL